MLIITYWIFLIVAFLLLGAGFFYEGNNFLKYSLILLSAIVFSLLAMQSFDVTQLVCEPLTNSVNITTTNVSTTINEFAVYNQTISCSEINQVEEVTGWFSGIMALFLLILTVILIIIREV